MNCWKTLLACAVATALHAGTALAEEPQSGGKLVAAVPITFKTLDPVFGDADITDRLALNQIYDPLFRLDDKGEMIPVLATGYSYNTDNTELTIGLRQGVTFHDGTPFNADAVVYVINRLKNSSGAMRTGTVSWMKTIEKTNEYEVKITVNAPTGYAVSSLAAEGTLMVSPAADKKYGQDFGRHPVGTGPFRFVDWIGTDRIILEKNPKYWMKDAAGRPLPYLDNVEIRSITNYATAMLELESGGIGLLNVVNPQDFERVRGSSELALLEGPQVLAHQMIVNVDHPPFDKKEVRQALAWAVDRETLAKAVAGEDGLVYPTYVPPAEWEFDPTIKGYTFDPKKAKELLTAAGHPNGVGFEMLTIQREPDITIAQILQQMLKESGFDMKLTVLERQAWIGRVITEGTYNASMAAGQHPRIDPHDTWARSYIKEQGGNWSRHKNQELVDLIYKARDTVAREDRKKLYRDVAEMALDENYVTFLFDRRAYGGVSKKVLDVKVDNGGAWILTDAWVKR